MGRYEVDRVLGVGGMGAVVAARDVESGERVAIKCLLLEHSDHDDVVARFHREARATTRLQSEHVARVFGSGALPTGVPFIVMEHLEGRDLKSLVKAQGKLSVKDAAAYVCQACGALAEAHALGIVHRDLKPANLFLTRRPNGAAMIKVLDFGIAKFLSPNIAGDQLDMTRTRAVLGSRAYMSPEQMLRPREVDTRSDIWSLGVILYYLVMGRSPFAAETIEALILNIVQAEPAPMTARLPDLPPGFEAVVRRCLAKAREERFPNVTELARALAPFTKEREIAGDRATLELPSQRVTDQGAPSVRAFSLTSDVPTETESPSGAPADTRATTPSGSPTRVMQPGRRRRSSAVTIAAAVIAGSMGALLLIRHLAPMTPSVSPSRAAASELRAVMAAATPALPAAAAPAPTPVPAIAVVPTATAAPVPSTSAIASAATPPRRPMATAAARSRPSGVDSPW